MRRSDAEAGWQAEPLSRHCHGPSPPEGSGYPPSPGIVRLHLAHWTTRMVHGGPPAPVPQLGVQRPQRHHGCQAAIPAGPAEITTSLSLNALT